MSKTHASGIEPLYPFLYATERDDAAVLDEVRRSTADKAREIDELRGRVLGDHARRIVECATAMSERFALGGKLLAFGNGGSSTDAMDVATMFLAPGARHRALPAMSLTADVAVLTALSNDVGFDVVFARQVAAFGRSRDIALGLSTSGGSENLLRAFDEASRRGLLTIGLAGYDGGKMAESDSIEFLFVIPSSSVHRIQEVQTSLYHLLWEMTLEALRRRGPGASSEASGPGAARKGGQVWRQP